MYKFPTKDKEREPNSISSEKESNSYARSPNKKITSAVSISPSEETFSDFLRDFQPLQDVEISQDKDEGTTNIQLSPTPRKKGSCTLYAEKIQS
ncbi:hypothetical protein J6590_061824 [Homalodisca vitripennis]|nr:hypothetical protein J6590_061824 [Homalodisca vitripennis]